MLGIPLLTRHEVTSCDTGIDGQIGKPSNPKGPST